MLQCLLFISAFTDRVVLSTAPGSGVWFSVVLLRLMLRTTALLMSWDVTGCLLLDVTLSAC